jgi:hypothetical protein
MLRAKTLAAARSTSFGWPFAEAAISTHSWCSGDFSDFEGLERHLLRTAKVLRTLA